MLLALLSCAFEPGSSGTPQPRPQEPVALVPPEEGLQLHMAFELEPFSEGYRCEIVRLDEVAGLKIGAMEHSSRGLHHFNAFALLQEPEEGARQGDCWELWEDLHMALTAPVYASQTPTFYGEFPEGVAAELPADWVLMELHAVNPGPEPITAEVWLNVYARQDYEALANGLYGNISKIDLAPHESEVVRQKCYVDKEIELIVLGSHMHARGIRFEIFRLDEAGKRDELLYENEDWESPELAFFNEQPIHLEPGDGLEWACHYRNDSDEHITYGSESDDEMCMLAGVYYPDQGFLICSKEP